VELSAGAAAGIEFEVIERGRGVLIYIVTPEMCKKCLLMQ
jgi:hypothetical protein